MLHAGREANCVCEVNYTQIEKEMLAILFGCTRFKHYIYGRRTVVESDCKPINGWMDV